MASGNSISKQLKLFIKERDSIAQALSRIEAKVADHELHPIPPAVVQKLFSDLEKYMNNLDSVHCRIVQETDDLDDHKLEFFNLNDIADNIYSELVRISPNISTKNTPKTETTPVNVHLPKIQLPTFDGNYQDWLSFRDLFETSIHNSSLPNVQKLTYLKSALKGEALRLIQAYSLTDANYVLAWQQLHDRYENPREILFTALKRLFEQSSSNSTAVSLRELVDVTRQCIRNLESLKLTSNNCSNALILYMVISRLDVTSRQQWEQKQSGTTIPSLDDLFDFIEQRARALSVTSSEKPRNEVRNKVHAHHSGAKQQKCNACNQHHPLFKCPTFLAMNISSKRDFSKKNNLCFNCLGSGHSSPNCTNSGRCKTCNLKHHTLLHKQDECKSQVKSPEVVLGHVGNNELSTGMLATAVVRIINADGIQYRGRALLDSGSTSSFITDSFVRKLGLKKIRNNAEVTGLGSCPAGLSKAIVQFKFGPHFSSSFNTQITALVLPRITENLPVHSCDKFKWSHLNNIVLADPHFNVSSPIDILLGSDVFWNILEGRKLVGEAHQPIAVSSQLGWLIAGSQKSQSKKVQVNIAQANINEIMERFWQVETIQVTEQNLRPDDKACEDHFENTHQVLEGGRFMVSVPFKSPRPTIGSSRHMAEKRLIMLEKRLQKIPHHANDYVDFMNEYLSLSHMTKVPIDEVTNPKHPIYFIPHHFVLKQESTTTKFRVVFDASAKSSSGISLNDAMLTGPTLQDTLVNIITRFRIHPVAYSADVAKMYRQILLNPKDRDLHRILWRESANEPIQEFRLNTVTYGTAAAPYLAVKVLQQLAKNNKQDLPLASHEALNSFYVDDLMGSSPDIDTALETQKQLLSLMDRGKLELRKWTSNNAALIDHLPDNLKETKQSKSISGDTSIKALGIRWNTKHDQFQFDKIVFASDKLQTKRQVLSDIAKLYDPLGWLSPIVVRAKILMQTLWKLNISWDDILPTDILDKWISYKLDLQNINQIRIPRCMVPFYAERVEIVGFSDASERAYGAVVYLRVIKEGKVNISLVQSKTRVAPVKQLSLPRLELCAATLLAELIQSVKVSLKLSIKSIYAWTDSRVVLSWISSHPTRWKAFVGNRVAEIQRLCPAVHWGHVPGSENPADVCSRGLNTSELITNELWWQGPPWLQTINHPSNQEAQNDDVEVALLEERGKALIFHSVVDNSLLQRYSSFSKLIRITAWCLRFLHKLKAKPNAELTLSATELREAEFNWIKLVQNFEFSSEITALGTNKELPKSSKLLSLSLFLDETGILRVGGRLRHSAVPVSQKFPILLPRSSIFTRLLVEFMHKKHLHAGPLLLQSVLQDKYWIIRIRDVCRSVVHKCVVCVKQRAQTLQQIMADLPKSRVTPSRPFQRCGVDYAGPFLLNPGLPRTKTTVKAYLCIFVCFATRAFHLELVSSLSTDAFLSTFRRFIARRGLPSDIYSDCGRNFIGANSEINKFLNSSQHAVKSDLAGQGVCWHFNPPGAPHFCGLWEAGVKSVKFHLNRIIGAQRMTFEELTTALTQIESCLNSRPITPMSSDPSDLKALTSGHFLVGGPLVSLADPDLTDVQMNRLTRWQLVQSQVQHFWKRWSSEFLTRLQQRPKWIKENPNLNNNDMVIIKDENLPVQAWRLGRVVEQHPGSDGKVRVVTVRTCDGQFRRPVHKLCRLPISPSDDDVI